MHPEFAAHGSFAHLKLGRAPRRDDHRTLELAKYLSPAILPTIPASADFVTGVPAWPMYGNDRLGDCTCAAVGHMIQAWTTAAGSERIPPDADIEQLYIPDTGVDDTGRVEIDVLNYWRQTGVGGDKIGAYVSVDPANQQMVRAAIWLFGGIYTGIALPRTAQGQPVWDLTGDPTDPNGPAYPGSWGGHAVPYEAYDDAGVTLITWGAPLKATWAYHGTYTDECYAIVSTDLLSGAGKSPAGFDVDQLNADLAAVSA